MGKHKALKTSNEAKARPLEDYNNSLDIYPFELIQLTPPNDYFKNQLHADSYLNVISALKQRQIDRACDILSDMTKNFPLDYEALNIQACFLIREKKFEDAKKLLRDAEKIKRNDPKILNNLGLVYYRLLSLTQSIDYYKLALKYAPSLAQIHFNLGLAFDLNNEHVNAYNAYSKSLQLEKTKEAAGKFGNLLRRGGKLKEAVSVLEANYNKYPQDLASVIYFADALIHTGDYIRARDLALKAILIDPTHPHSCMLFSDQFENKYFEFYSQEAEAAIISALKSNATSISTLRSAWLSLLKLNPQKPEFKTLLTLSTYDDFVSFFSDKNRVNFYTEYFLTGIKNCLITDPHLERILSYWRKMLLTGHINGTLLLTHKDRMFLAVLSENCFFNEYVFASDDEEAKILTTLSQTDFPDPDSLLLLSCYKSLLDLPHHARFIDHAPYLNDYLSEIFTFQIREPLIEKEFHQTLKSFTTINDPVSQKVKEQYEENPYPRWKTISSFEPYGNRPKKIKEKQNINILVAGCGTGQQIIAHARIYQNFRFTAIDLSSASLCYAMRKCAEQGLDAVDFYQEDILNISKIGKKFDHIFCTGVLHHMKDPDEGMAALTQSLKPGGMMRLAVYSEIARRVIIKGRDFIQKNNYPSTIKGIRDFRQMVFALPDGHELAPLKNMMDFYTLSNCRDLLFHVQEHRFTIPDLDQYLKRHNLVFCGFSISNEIINQFKSDFPNLDPRILLHWQEFEEKYPDTFYGMYQFMAQKPEN